MNKTFYETTPEYNLGCAATNQAIKDFFATSKETRKKEILKDLRRPLMVALSNGMSVIAAEKLETEPEAVQERFKKYEKEIN